MLPRFTYSYDDAGNLTVTVDSNGARATHTYDGKSRLTRGQTTGTGAHDYTYSYDANDDRLTSSETGGVVTFNYNAFGQLTTSTDGSLVTTYTYDDDGNQTVTALQGSDPVTMAYDKENRMNRHQQGATVVTYTYASDGLKRSEVTSGGTTTLVWDGSDYLQGRS
ncbi:MAG: hypothetical protein WD716_00015 [Fimbriimonadaceae bacterium]